LRSRDFCKIPKASPPIIFDMKNHMLSMPPSIEWFQLFVKVHLYKY